MSVLAAVCVMLCNVCMSMPGVYCESLHVRCMHDTMVSVQVLEVLFLHVFKYSGRCHRAVVVINSLRKFLTR